LGKTDPNIEEQFQKYYDEGFSDEEIAERVGKKNTMVGYWRRKKGLPIVFENRKRLTLWESKKIQDYLAFERKFKKIKK
jgi:predicted DNA-binding protein YlxM (UPF0122 family)